MDQLGLKAMLAEQPSLTGNQRQIDRGWRGIETRKSCVAPAPPSATQRRKNRRAKAALRPLLELDPAAVFTGSI